MILDSGICTIFLREEICEPGEMPRFDYREPMQSYYGELDYLAMGTWPTQGREETQTDARIRIHQNRAITQRHVVLLYAAETINEEAERRDMYAITRAWHGTDEESGEKITDLTLIKVTP